MLRWQVLCLTALVAVAAAANEEKKIVCYYASWAVYRIGAGSSDIRNIDPKLCTHLVYAFVGLGEEGAVRSLDEYRDLPENFGKDGFGEFNALREANPRAKTLVAIGGWNEGSDRYSTLAADPELRAAFVKNVVAFVEKHGFDGFDVDWEYPAQRGGAPEDVENYVHLLRELRQAFDKKGLILSAAVAAIQASASISYNVTEISKYLHFINLMTYDYHGSWEDTTGFNSPLYPAKRESGHQKTTNVDASVKYWLSQGAPKEKLVISIPAYGRSFTLANVSETSVGSKRSGPGKSGSYTRVVGMLGYHEICKNLKTGSWKVVRDAEQRVPYAYKADQWVGYDDVASATEKAEYVKKLGLGGVMIWSIDTDDFRGECGESYPLLKAVNRVLVPRAESTSTAKPTMSEPFRPTSDDSPVAALDADDDEDDICVKPGYVRDPYDCAKYYLCQLVDDQFYPREFRCPPGLHFNLVKKICDWPNNVKCKPKSD